MIAGFTYVATKIGLEIRGLICLNSQAANFVQVTVNLNYTRGAFLNSTFRKR
ncbi:MAG: hypothetical protein KGL35_12730 [Bradyrhizobium sp.]|nr:hypothetical protein [Pseudomonadota bacterium]MDE2469575.1 hypothetical protein [Bradyrhizobium sp.]